MWVHIWSQADCVLRLVWRTAVAARRLKPLTAAAVLACGGITVVPPGPPTSAQPPVPPVMWTPPPMQSPGLSWGFHYGGPDEIYNRPTFEYVPPEISPPELGPILSTPIPQEETMVLPPTTTIAFHGNPFAEAPCDTPAAMLPEPGGLAIVGFGLIALYLIKRKQT